MSIVAITGGRDRQPTLTELERCAKLLIARRATIMRHGDCRPRKDKHGRMMGSTDWLVARYVAARGLAKVEAYPAEWDRYGRSAGPLRNRAMLDGKRPGELVPDPPADVLIRFDGGAGTRDCCVAATERGRVTLYIHAVAEPRVWNRHWGDPPGPWVYSGRGTPVGNELYNLMGYAEWLKSRIANKSPDRDLKVIDWIRALTPAHYVVCSCWPSDCHAALLVKAWRWLTGATAC